MLFHDEPLGVGKACSVDYNCNIAVQVTPWDSTQRCITMRHGNLHIHNHMCVGIDMHTPRQLIRPIASEKTICE